MAKAHLNSAFSGISGKSGGLVFRRVRGETIIAQQPDAPRRKPSTAQLAQRKRFVRAAAYARQVLADPWQRRTYEALAKERDRRADKLVIADFLTPPTVDEIDTSEYRGQPGGIVRVLATDDIEVVSVTVTIATSDEGIVETGPASKVHGVWRYTTTARAPARAALTITAVASDRPGNEAVRSVAYP